MNNLTQSGRGSNLNEVERQLIQDLKLQIKLLAKNTGTTYEQVIEKLKNSFGVKKG